MFLKKQSGNFLKEMATETNRNIANDHNSFQGLNMFCNNKYLTFVISQMIFLTPENLKRSNLVFMIYLNLFFVQWSNWTFSRGLCRRNFWV